MSYKGCQKIRPKAIGLDHSIVNDHIVFIEIKYKYT